MPIHQEMGLEFCSNLSVNGKEITGQGVGNMPSWGEARTKYVARLSHSLISSHTKFSHYRRVQVYSLEVRARMVVGVQQEKVRVRQTLHPFIIVTGEGEE